MKNYSSSIQLLWSQSYVDQDGAEPSSNSVSAHNLLRLAAIMDSSSYRERAEAIFAVFSSRLESMPVAVPEMLRALMLHRLPVLQVWEFATFALDWLITFIMCSMLVSINEVYVHWAQLMLGCVPVFGRVNHVFL